MSGDTNNLNQKRIIHNSANHAPLLIEPGRQKGPPLALENDVGRDAARRLLVYVSMLFNSPHAQCCLAVLWSVKTRRFLGLNELLGSGPLVNDGCTWRIIGDLETHAVRILHEQCDCSIEFLNVWHLKAI